MKIAVQQFMPITGDIKSNTLRIIEHYQTAIANKNDICIFPELALTGYMAKDLFLRNEFINDCHKYIDKIVYSTKNKQTYLVLPTCFLENNCLYNSALLIFDGEIIFKHHKIHLPNYGMFDEKRYFSPGNLEQQLVVTIKNYRIALPICEDIWENDVCEHILQQGAELILSPSSSPFSRDKLEQREKIINQRFQQNEIPIVYCNSVGAEDGICFDGNSLFIDKTSIKYIAPAFAEHQAYLKFHNGTILTDDVYYKNSVEENILKAMIFATSQYFLANNFSEALIGLSGGVDSALVTYILVKALGNSNVKPIMLPSKFSSNASKLDAMALIRNLNLDWAEYNISKSVDQICADLNINFNWQDADITVQNIQARVRGTMLMALANEQNALLITTGNKSEYAVGYATLYGDMNGAFNPIKDLYKTEIYRLCKYINEQNNYDIIPTNILIKPATAELTASQKDSDSIPEYEILDEVLIQFFDNSTTHAQLVKKYGKNLIHKISKMVNHAEFKRQQSAPGVRLSDAMFNIDRRVTISNKY